MVAGEPHVVILFPIIFVPNRLQSKSLNNLCLRDMKTVLFIDSSGRRYFQRSGGGEWLPVERPSRKDRLWVLVNLPDESLEVIDLPRLYGSDRSSFLERRLASAFPESTCRASYLLSGGLFNPGKVMLTGLSTSEDIAGQLAAEDAIVVGLWGVAALLTVMAKRFVAPDLLVILPSVHALRILVVKNRIPVLTRYVHCGGDSIADEILLTRSYLENQRMFERGKPPPVLFLGDPSTVLARLTNAGLSLLPASKEFLPKGEAGWLHPFFNRLVSTPSCQLAPLPLRAKYLVGNVRWAAYAGAALSLGVGSYYCQADIRAVMALHERAETLQSEVQSVALERERLSALIKKSGADPELVRRATQFVAQEITAAPSGDAFLPLAAAAIADVPEARVQTLSFRLAANGESVCQNKQDQQANNSQVAAVQPTPGIEDAASGSLRQAEIQMTVKLPGDLSPKAKAEARKHISRVLQGMAGVKLLQDPALAARKAILTGGAGANIGLAEEHWCMSVPWKTKDEKIPANEGEGAL